VYNSWDSWVTDRRGSTLGQGNCPQTSAFLQMWHETLMNSKHRHIGAIRSVLWPSKYAKMRFQSRLPRPSSRLGRGHPIFMENLFHIYFEVFSHMHLVKVQYGNVLFSNGLVALLASVPRSFYRNNSRMKQLLDNDHQWFCSRSISGATVG